MRLVRLRQKTPLLKRDFNPPCFSMGADSFQLFRLSQDNLFISHARGFQRITNGKSAQLGQFRIFNGTACGIVVARNHQFATRLRALDDVCLRSIRARSEV